MEALTEIIEAPSPNNDLRDASPDMIVLHYTGMKTGAAALGRLCDPASKVSSHYLVEEDGRVFRLVAEDRRAWHAGVSSWAGRGYLNDCSIGIEIVNPGHEWGYRPFPVEQMRAVQALVAEIMIRWSIPPERVVGHSDIAPTRKDDPGELFDWKRLAGAHLAIWPDAADDTDAGRLLDPEGVASLSRVMKIAGYDLTDFAAALRAFRRRFRPEALDGLPTMRDFLIAREVALRWPAILEDNAIA